MFGLGRPDDLKVAEIARRMIHRCCQPAEPYQGSPRAITSMGFGKRLATGYPIAREASTGGRINPSH